MKNWTKALLVTVVAFALSPSTPASAQDAAPEPTGYEACAVLDMEPKTVYDDLLEFKTVFGKDTLEWTEADYNQLIELANACHGVMINAGRVIDAAEWHQQIEYARQEVYPLSAIHQIIMERVGYIAEGDVQMPACTALLAYTYDTVDDTDNSKDVFGEDMMAMEDREVQNVIDHANQCQLFLPDYAHRFTTATRQDIVKLLNSMMDRGLLIRQRRNDWRYQPNKAASDVMVEVDGVKIPPTFAQPETQKLINRFNRSARLAGGLSMDTTAAIISIADDISLKSPPLVDRLYIDEIKRRVTKDIFDRTELKLK